MPRASGISIAEIAEAQLILFDRTSSYHGLTSSFFREAGVTPRGVMELDNIDAAKKMVQQGLGVALLPQTAVAGELADGSLVAVRIADVEPAHRQIVAVRRKDDGDRPGLWQRSWRSSRGAEVGRSRGRRPSRR